MLRNASVQLSIALMTLVPNREHFGDLQNARSGLSRSRKLAAAGIAY